MVLAIPYPKFNIEATSTTVPDANRKVNITLYLKSFDNI